MFEEFALQILYYMNVFLNQGKAANKHETGLKDFLKTKLAKEYLKNITLQLKIYSIHL